MRQLNTLSLRRGYFRFLVPLRYHVKETEVAVWFDELSYELCILAITEADLILVFQRYHLYGKRNFWLATERLLSLLSVTGAFALDNLFR